MVLFSICIPTLYAFHCKDFIHTSLYLYIVQLTMVILLYSSIINMPLFISECFKIGVDEKVLILHVTCQSITLGVEVAIQLCLIVSTYGNHITHN